MEDLWVQLTDRLKFESSKAIVIQTENSGRGLVATEDLLKGDDILIEKPIIVGPPQSVGPHFCVNCSQPLTVGVLQGNYKKERKKNSWLSDRLCRKCIESNHYDLGKIK